MEVQFALAVAGTLWLLALVALLTGKGRVKRRVVAQLAGFTWTREDFCRGWLITGDTGSGKTRSGITPLLYQVFTNEPTWGGLCIDEKGLYWETLSAMAKHFGREDDLILLQVRPEGAPHNWQPRHTYNLTSDRSIPFNTFAKAVVDTASSLGQSGDKGFFRNQAQTHIAAALDTLREIGADVTLENAYHLLLDERDLEEALGDLASTGHLSRRRGELADHFRSRFLSQPPEQIGGVKETIANYLQAFITRDIAQVFCPGANTFDFADIDRGKIICVAMPQKFQVERRYVNTFLKMLFYTHALRRFDEPSEERRHDNLLILWADEAQRFVSASEEGMSDYNCIDVIREAQATVVAAQSSTSFIPPLGREKARVFTLNLRNRLIFRAADEEGAMESADFLGKRRVIKKSWGYSGGKMSRNYSEQEEYKIKPHILRAMPKHTAVVVHCEYGHRRKHLLPIESDGRVCAWFCG